MATDFQITIAQMFDIDVSADSFPVAAARILDIIGSAVDNHVRFKTPTQKQFEVAPLLGLDITGDSYRVAFAKISDAYRAMNEGTIQRLQLKRGDIVLRHDHLVLAGQPCHCADQITYSCREFIISKVRSDSVYFQGVGNERAWGGQLTLVQRAEDQ